MPYNGGYDNVDEDELNDELEDDGQGGHYKAADDHVIVLVDARKNMFQTMHDNDGVRPSLRGRNQKLNW